MTVKELLRSEVEAGARVMSEVRSKEILESIGIPTTGGRIVKSEEEAVKAAGEIGYPVALKIHSPDITHKSDVGGVRTSLENARMVSDAYRMILEKVKEKEPEAVIEGVNVQKMAPPGVELIVGTSTDRTFGPVIMFGTGGVLAELYKDVCFRVVPISKWDAEAMIREIKGFPLLDGYRGSEKVDLETLRETLLKVSDLVDHYREIAEMDINPLVATAGGVIAADARIVLKGGGNADV